MPKIRNVNPLGCVDLPLIGRQGPANDEAGTGCLIPGEVFEASDDIAERLLEQVGNYELVTDKKKG